MTVLDHLWTMPGVYWGLGRGPNSDFVSRVAVQPQDDGSVTLDYEAWSSDEGLQHAEAMRMCRTPQDADRVVLMATSDGTDDTMVFREGDSGVFGSTGADRVGLVLVPDDGRLGFSWWWPDENGVLAQQSRAELTLLRPLVTPPGSLHAPAPAEPSSQPDEPTPEPLPEVPWPGIVVLAGNGTGVVAQRLAERLTRAAVVRTDLFDKAVRGSDASTVDPALRHRITIAVAHGYALSGHPVILHGAAARGDHALLVDELRAAGLTPVRLVDVADGEDYGEVARRLIDGD
jgi:hypothetical protein